MAKNIVAIATTSSVPDLSIDEMKSLFGVQETKQRVCSAQTPDGQPCTNIVLTIEGQYCRRCFNRIYDHMKGPKGFSQKLGVGMMWEQGSYYPKQVPDPNYGKTINVGNEKAGKKSQQRHK